MKRDNAIIPSGEQTKLRVTKYLNAWRVCRIEGNEVAVIHLKASIIKELSCIAEVCERNQRERGTANLRKNYVF